MVSAREWSLVYPRALRVGQFILSLIIAGAMAKAVLFAATGLPDLVLELNAWGHNMETALAELRGLGLVDVMPRALKGEPYTFWDYRQAAFGRGWGMRIDLVYANEPFAARLTDDSQLLGSLGQRA